MDRHRSRRGRRRHGRASPKARETRRFCRRPPDDGPQTSDGFESAHLGLQWQWHGNSQFGWHSLTYRPDALRLFPYVPDDAENLWSVPNLLLQKFPAPSFTATTEVSCELEEGSGHGGLLVLGEEYASLSVRRTADGAELVQGRNTAPADGDSDEVVERVPLQHSSARLRATVEDDGQVEFSYATGDAGFESVGESFQAQQGRWLGVNIGLFTVQSAEFDAEAGFCDFDYFRVDP